MKKQVFISFIITILSCGISLNAFSQSTANGHTWVDLGLPSGIKWATCNVGARFPEDYGSYYAWGQMSYSITYAFCYNSYSYTEDPPILPYYADIATIFGDGWRMPTKENFEELKNHCVWTWTSVNRIYGYKVTGRNGNSIFLPASGYRYREQYEHYNVSVVYKKKKVVRKISDLKEGNSCGYYWSSSLNTPEQAYIFSFDEKKYDTYVADRYVGLTVRPVYSLQE